MLSKLQDMALASDSADVSVGTAMMLADLSGALYWDAHRLLIVSDLHLEKGSSFARRGMLLPPFDTIATLGRLGALITHYNPKRVIALGDSFHDSDAHTRLEAGNRDILTALQAGREWVWISGNHDPDLPDDLGGDVSAELVIEGVTFRHEPTGAAHEIAGHLHPKARIATRGHAVERRCFAGDGMRLVMPAFGAYTGGLNIRTEPFTRIFGNGQFVAHVMGDRRMHAISATRCR